MNSKKSGLGRGLSSLLGENNNDILLSNDINTKTSIIPIENIEPGPWQARIDFNKESLQNLVQSISEHGILNPLILTKKDNKDNEYYLVAGERRWRACQMSGIYEVPAIIYNKIDHNKATEISLVENIQREDLNIIEEASGYNELILNYKYSQGKIAKTLGKSRSHITNTLRLLNLPETVLNMIKSNLLTAGHARTLIGNPRAVFLAEEIINNGLSVREAEALASRNKKQKQQQERVKSNKINDLEKRASEFLGLNIKINYNENTSKSKVFITFSNDEQLVSFFDKLGFQE